MYSENYDILLNGNETFGSGTNVFSNDQIQTIMESGDTTLSEPFEFAKYPLPNLESTYNTTQDEEIYLPLLNCENGLGSMLKDVLLPLQDPIPVSDQTVDHQIVVLNQPERNVRFR
jgi:hypothetical protein